MKQIKGYMKKLLIFLKIVFTRIIIGFIIIATIIGLGIGLGYFMANFFAGTEIEKWLKITYELSWKWDIIYLFELFFTGALVLMFIFEGSMVVGLTLYFLFRDIWYFAKHGKWPDRTLPYMD